jgi:hypothetical protein
MHSCATIDRVILPAIEKERSSRGMEREVEKEEEKEEE